MRKPINSLNNTSCATADTALAQEVEWLKAPPTRLCREANLQKIFTIFQTFFSDLPDMIVLT